MPRSRGKYASLGRVLTHDPERDPEGEGLHRFPGMFGGLIDDVKRRHKFCRADYGSALRHWSKTLSAALFMLFATLFSTIALGALVERETEQRIGLSEYLLMNSAAGVAHSIAGCQPLLVLRPTGPITAITIKLAAVADRLHLDFNQYLAATGLCIALLMTVCAALELSRHIRRITPFTHDIFACFVCSIYVVDGVRGVFGRFGGRPSQFGEALFASNLSLFTFGVSAWLGGAARWRLFSPGVRSFLADYAVTLAVVATTVASFVVSGVEVARISLPTHVSPTCFTSGDDECVAEADRGFRQHARPWRVSMEGAPTRLWLLAFASAVPITFFFYMDQNISSLLCQRPKHHLHRGHYYHSSFLAMGCDAPLDLPELTSTGSISSICTDLPRSRRRLFNALGPAFGLPFVTGSLPHSPQFVRALTYQTKSGGHAVAEGRVAPLLTYLGIGVPLLLPWLVHLMPHAAIDGVLTYVGVEGILETQLWERLLLLVTHAHRRRKPQTRTVSARLPCHAPYAFGPSASAQARRLVPREPAQAQAAGQHTPLHADAADAPRPLLGDQPLALRPLRLVSHRLTRPRARARAARPLQRGGARRARPDRARRRRRAARRGVDGGPLRRRGAARVARAITARRGQLSAGRGPGVKVKKWV